MKKEFVETLIKLAERDKNIYLLTGDLGFSFFEEFAKKFPTRYINCGIAEQNMVGLAAGLALSGKKPYVHSIIPFMTFRCLEQIRNDVAYQNLDVKIIGSGAGLSYGTLGATHYALEDIAVLRCLPNMAILSPADPTELKKLVIQSYKTANPTYIRLDRNSKNLYDSDSNIILGQPTVAKKGRDGLIIATGSLLEEGISAAKKLGGKGYEFKVLSMHTLKPVNEKNLIQEIGKQKFIFTIEEHDVACGLGSIVGQILLKNNFGDVIFQNIGISKKCSGVIGRQDYLRKYHKIDADSIYKKILKYFK